MADATVQWWLTTADGAQQLAPQAPILLRPSQGVPSSDDDVVVEPARRFQRIEGFGASFTETASWLLRERLSDADRAALLREWLDVTSGIGMSFVRQPMGATDIARDYYSYADVPAGTESLGLDGFTISRDEEHILPVLREALSVRPGLTLMATPWSPPSWMRTDQSMRGSDGGTLRRDAYPAYAEYFVRFLQAYAQHGVDVRYVTVQNEPSYAPHYPGMLFPPAQQAEFIAEHLGPALAARGLATRILVHDHNWDEWQQAADLLDRPDVAKYVAGTAFHRYAGDAAAGSRLNELHPDKGVFLTEASTDVTISLTYMVLNIVIKPLRNWSRSVILWNLLSDEANGPYMRPGGCAICRPVTSLRTDGRSWTHNADYYALGHVSKFVLPQSVRIASTENEYSTLPNVAFENPDGTLILLVVNQGLTEHRTTVRAGADAFDITLPSGAVATFTWPGPGEADRRSMGGTP